MPELESAFETKMTAVRKLKLRPQPKIFHATMLVTRAEAILKRFPKSKLGRAMLQRAEVMRDMSGSYAPGELFWEVEEATCKKLLRLSGKYR